MTEVVAAFWGKVHRGELSPELVADLDDEFIADLDAGRFAVVGLGTQLVTTSLDVVRRHRLRGADALQLATAMTAREADPSLDTFAVFDARLRNAATAEGFTLLPTAPSAI